MSFQSVFFFLIFFYPPFKGPGPCRPPHFWALNEDDLNWDTRALIIIFILRQLKKKRAPRRLSVSIQPPPAAAQTYEWHKDPRAGCWLSDCCASTVHPEGKLKSPSMHAGPRVKWVTYKCSLVAACVAGMGRANESWAVLKAEGRRRWMDASFMIRGGYEA